MHKKLLLFLCNFNNGIVPYAQTQGEKKIFICAFCLLKYASKFGIISTTVDPEYKLCLLRSHKVKC